MDFNNYFIALEKRVIEFENYIEISPNNYPVYSNNLCLLLLSICAEFEIVAKIFAKDLGKNRINNIKDIYNFLNSLPILDGKSKILDQEISLEIYKIKFNPFENWTSKNSPFWWHAYNGIKHDRLNTYQNANLKAVLFSLGALSIINHFYIWHKEVSTKSINAAVLHMERIPEIFQLHGVQYRGPFSVEDVFD